MRRVAVIMMVLLLGEGVLAEDWDVHRRQQEGWNRPVGLSATINVGMLVANKKQAGFYSGIPENSNMILRVLHSEGYGVPIWNSLVNGGYINPSAIGSYSQLKVDEYGEMHYKLTYQIGMGIRYDWESGWGFLLRFDYSKLTAVGAFNLSSTNGTGILQNNNQYIRCSVGGVENRINIDLGVAKRFFFSESLAMELDLGFNLNNLKVKKNEIEIAGTTYSILDVWGGQSPSDYVGSYEYINQGGIGYGGFGTLAFCYLLPGENSVGTIDLGYTCMYSHYNLENYSGWSPQHTVFLRFNLNTFSFFDK